VNRHVNRGLLFWGVALITAGVVALAASQGWFDTSILGGAWRLWPVVLIAIGLSLVLSRTSFAWVGTLAAALVVGLAGGALISGAPAFSSCNGEPGPPQNSTGAFYSEHATVDLELTCGTLELSMAKGSAWSADTSITGGVLPVLSQSATELSLRSNERNFPFDGQRQSWAIHLGRDVSYDLSATLSAADATIDASGGTFEGLQLTSNAGSARLLLGSAVVSGLDVQLNAGSAKIIADGDGDVAGSLQANAGGFDLCVPDSVGLQIIVTSSVAFSHNLEDRGLTNEGEDVFVSPNFGSAAHKVVLQVQGNAATFTLNPEEGCA
jgi:hypothetical protein